MNICKGSGNATVNVTIPNWFNYIGENSGNGLTVHSTGTVTIKNSTFKYNGVKGMDVETMGSIYLYKDEVFHNYDTGAYLSTLTATRARLVTITDSTFTENEGTGLMVFSNGSINLKGVTADDNTSPRSATLDKVPVSVYDQIKEGDLAEVYYFYGYGGQWLDIIMKSTDFDAYLELNDNVGDPITLSVMIEGPDYLGSVDLPPLGSQPHFLGQRDQRFVGD